ncbi:MAG: hypothetical protein PHF60_05620 [Candidatus ainarchaeum sp.]|nr:hypothetical protein [Candidatus ainarchaeum sp.]
MSMTDNPANLRQQARTIASSKPARAAWSELKSWAAGKGPIAMKSAADEFIAIHGRSPEAAILLPEVMQSAAWGMPPMERPGMLAGQRPSPMLGRTSPTQFNPREPKEMLPLSLFFRPKQNSAPQLGAVIPVDAQHDMVYLKDAQFRMRGAAGASLPKPMLSQASQKSFDASKSPDSFHMGAQGSQGGEILRNLVQRMRTHGKDDFTQSHSISIRDLPAPKARALIAAPKTAKTRKRILKTTSAKKKAKPAKATRKVSARKPARRPARKAPIRKPARIKAKRAVKKAGRYRR